MDCEDRLTRYMMKWTVGMPMETQLSITALILSGSFDVLPPELKLMFAHGIRQSLLVFLLFVRMEPFYAVSKGLHMLLSCCAPAFVRARAIRSTGGGSFSFLLGRLENAYIHRDVARGTAQHPPSHYLNRFATDSVSVLDGMVHITKNKIGVVRTIEHTFFWCNNLRCNKTLTLLSRYRYTIMRFAFSTPMLTP